MKRLIIDNDGLSDDVAAIVMACAREDVIIEAITVVRGCVPLDQAVQNVLYTTELCQSDAPVYPGAHKPLLRELAPDDYHGKDGLGDIGLPLYGRTPENGHAVNVLVRKINVFADEIILVTLGPLTNVALALMMDPSIAKKVARCVVMGSSGFGVGNVTPVSEANIWMDPEAAKIVLESGMKIELVGWDIAYTDGIFTPEEQSELRRIGNKQAEFFVDVNEILLKNALAYNDFAGIDYADPIAMAVALEPSIVTYAEAVPTVITTDDVTRGQVVLARRAYQHPEDRAKINVVTRVDPAGFKQLVHKSLAYYSV